LSLPQSTLRNLDSGHAKTPFRTLISSITNLYIIILSYFLSLNYNALLLF